MSHTLTPNTATNTLRGWIVRMWNEPDVRSVLIGLTAMLVFHLLLLLVGPRLFPVVVSTAVPRPEDEAKHYNIELMPDPELKPVEKQPDPFRFVETNPDVPDNTPDKTVNFAAQNQQVAQEKPTPDGKSDRPALEGKKDFESNQIVSGRLTTPLENMQAIPPSPQTAETEQTIRAPQRLEQNPLAGFEKQEGENKDGIGTNIAPQLANAQAIPEKIDGARDVPLVEGATSMMPMIDPKRPQARPQLTRTVQARPAILAQNNFGTKNIGPTAVDAKWSQYGEYLKRMIETVQIEWERIIINLNLAGALGSTVSVKFFMDADGKIATIVNVESTANDTATRACISAITERAPYGPWTDDMRAVLGEKQEMTFTFHYMQ